MLAAAGIVDAAEAAAAVRRVEPGADAVEPAAPSSRSSSPSPRSSPSRVEPARRAAPSRQPESPTPPSRARAERRARAAAAEPHARVLDDRARGARRSAESSLDGAGRADRRRGDALVIRGVTKSFGDTRAVDGIDLTVPAGTFYGLVGPNGAGKTTTLSMIAGLLRPDRGIDHASRAWMRHPTRSPRSA